MTLNYGLLSEQLLRISVTYFIITVTDILKGVWLWLKRHAEAKARISEKLP